MFRVRSLVLLVLVLVVATPMLAQAQASTPLISVSSSTELGKFLVGQDGMTLYSYTPDPLNQTVCYDKCAQNWPPLLVDSADKLTVADGIPGTFSTITRKDGTLQVAYNGIALYYWVKDTKAGDTTGHRVGRVWWVVPPATAYAQRIPKLGSVLVGANGMTLYLYTKDTADTSNCYDQCATNWPPLIVKSADDLVPGINLPGKFGTTTRKDGSLQVTYNGAPLYYWKNDKAIGDVTGEGVGNVWYTIPQETVGVSNTKDLGDFLVSDDGMTLYAYSEDKAGESMCTGDCAKNWPPFTVSSDDRLAADKGVMGKLATIKRDDNTLQVTYNGVPLYFFAKDKVPGDATGQNVGNKWAVVKP
jgi:predicted lipoprotein with Yx(FWY)xxD motif